MARSSLLPGQTQPPKVDTVRPVVPSVATPQAVDDATAYETARRDLALYATKFRDQQLAGFHERGYADLHEQLSKEIEASKERLSAAQKELDKVNTWWPSGWAARWSGALAGSRKRVQAEVQLYESLLEKQYGLEAEFQQASETTAKHLSQVETALAKAAGKTGAEGKALLVEAFQSMQKAEQSLVIRAVDRTKYEGMQQEARELCEGKKGVLANFEIGGKELRKFAVWGTAALVTAAIALPLMAPMALGVTAFGLLWYGLAIPIFAGVVGTAAGAAVGAAASVASEVTDWANGKQTATQCFNDFKQQFSADLSTAKDGATMAATMISAGKFVKYGFGLSKVMAAAKEAPKIVRLAHILGPRMSGALTAVVGGSVGSSAVGTSVSAAANAAQGGLEVSSGEKTFAEARSDFLSKTMDDGVKSVQLGVGTTLALTVPSAMGTVTGALTRIPGVGSYVALPLRLLGLPAAGAATGAVNTVVEHFGEVYRTHRDFVNNNDIEKMSDKELALERFQARRDARSTYWQFYWDRLPTNMLVGAISAPLSRFFPQSQATTSAGFIREQLGVRALAARGSVLLAESAVDAAAVSYRRNPSVDDVKEVTKHSILGNMTGDIFASATRGRIR